MSEQDPMGGVITPSGVGKDPYGGPRRSGETQGQYLQRVSDAAIQGLAAQASPGSWLGQLNKQEGGASDNTKEEGIGPYQALCAGHDALIALFNAASKADLDEISTMDMARVVMEAVLPFIVRDARVIAGHTLMAESEKHRERYLTLPSATESANLEFTLMSAFQEAARLVGNGPK